MAAFNLSNTERGMKDQIKVFIFGSVRNNLHFNT